MNHANSLHRATVAIWTDERFKGGRGDAIALAAARLAKSRKVITPDMFGIPEQTTDHPNQTYLELPI